MLEGLFLDQKTFASVCDLYFSVELWRTVVVVLISLFYSSRFVNTTATLFILAFSNV